MKTTFYLQFEGIRSAYNSARIGRIMAKRITQRRPDYPISGSVVVKMTVELPEWGWLIWH